MKEAKKNQGDTNETKKSNESSLQKLKRKAPTMVKLQELTEKRILEKVGMKPEE